VPASGIRWLRFDPTDAAGEIFIQRVQIVDAAGTARDVPPVSFRPANQIARFVPEGEGVRIVTTPDATDPFLLFPMGCFEPSTGWPATVTNTWLAAISVAVLALLGGAVWAIAGTAFSPTSAVGRGPRWTAAIWIGALALTILGGKLLLMRVYPVMTPFWDQWDGEAAILFVPFGACSLTWEAMFGLHNEHRVFFTRLLALDLLGVNGQWDPRLEQVVNAGMHALTAGLAALMIWISAGRRRLDLIVVLTALTFALPFSWENTLFGFQSAFYFLLLFSLLAMWLVTEHAVGSLAWMLGWASALCAIFTAASGFLAPITIGVISVMQAATDRSRARSAAVNLVIAIAVFGAGYAVSAPPLPHHEVYRVRTAADFLTALGRSLAWPWVGRPEMALIGWLPLVLIGVTALWRRLETTGLERFTIGIGVWVGLHAVALAYGRGAGGPMPAGRYMDFLSIGFLANAMALTTVLDRLPASSDFRRLATAAAAVWLLAGFAGLNSLVKQSIADLRVRQSFHDAHTANVRRYVLTSDATSLVGKTPMAEVPYPDPQRLTFLLEDPYIRRILPAAVRAPIDLERAETSSETFVRDGVYGAARLTDPLRPSWGSFAAGGNEAQGEFESLPIARCELGSRLRFEVAGHLGFDDHRLAVRTADGGRERQVGRRGPMLDGWSPATVACPDAPFTVTAADHSRWSWFAFRPPVEIGWASVAAEALIARAWELLLAALALLALAARWT
jgi:hypothetical protein